MKDEIDEFLDKLKKQLAKKHPKPDEYDPDWLKKYAAMLEWKSKSKVERIIERQEAFLKPRKSQPH